MRKLAIILLSIMLLCFFITRPSFAATSNILLFLDGKQLNAEVSPRKVGDTSMVPIRIISEALGAKVGWNQLAHQVTVDKGDVHLQLVIDKKDATVNGKIILLEMAPSLIAGNTLLPVRFVAEQLGIQVNWDEMTQSVYLKQNKGLPVASTSPEIQIQSLQTVNDQLIIQANANMQAHVFPLSNPDRLVIDLASSTLSTQMGNPVPGQIAHVQSSNPWISNIRYAVDDPQPSATRVVLDFKGNTHYQILDSGSKNKLVVQINPVQRYKVVIDPGHGDHDTGAVSITGKYEKIGNFRVIHKTTMPAILLENGYLSNAYDEAQLFSPQVQDRIAVGIVSGIKSYLNIP